jgi:uncharacterized membrane protein YdbT with pleckstrin-like domain
MTSQDVDSRAITIRRHPVVLTRRFAATLGGLIIVAIISQALAPDTTIVICAWVAWGVLLTRFIWKAVEWLKESLVITPQQVLLSSGIFSRTTTYTPMTRVTNMSLQEPLLGRWLGYGELILELSGQDQSFRVIDHVPYSDRLFFELYGWIFPQNDQ